jgi:hypothetical protein
MTYRNKLRLRRFLIILAIVLLALVIVGLIGFSYLGRYVVYTEDGAHFSFHSQAPSAPEAEQAAAPVESPVLVTGSSIREQSILEDGSSTSLQDSEVKGLLVDYVTLSDPTAVSAVDLSTGAYNTLVLEMRAGGSAILDTDAVRQLISRAKSAQMHLVALMSCLNDSSYALSHTDEALAISGGTLWMNSAGSYWLDPTNADVQSYLAGMINQLETMGFQEVILNNFSFPTTDEIVYSSDSTRESMLQDAYKALENKVGLDCTLGLLIKDPESGHQAFDLAEHLYVYYSDGSSLKQYVDDHPDTYLVFLTSSHDTRFDDYGKVYTQQSVDYFSSLPDLDTSNNDTTDTTETSPEP